LAKLIIYEELEDETIFETFELTDTGILIGSDSDNHLILETPEIDPSHASLELRDGHWILQDLGGPGGTAVNGKVIEGPFSLDHEDLIELSHIKIKFQDPGRAVTNNFSGKNSSNENQTEVHIRGRVWLAALAGFTIAIIFVILLLLIAAHYLGIISIGDLLPSGLIG
jgi:pSer/pThr/pTyr-binding forkhead associated (FHA) protein